MKRQARSSKGACVKVVADSAETLDGLHAYLGRLGLSCSGTRDLSGVERWAAEVTAAVLFPDDFEVAEVVEAISALQRARPRLLIVLVTSAPQSFGKLTVSVEPAGPVVLAKPALGWALVDLLRAHASS